MANNRKLQGEIDKLLKKTSEGLEEYEDLFDKFSSASNPSAKERLEADLKREIKKLQRQREQIKNYVASPDVKDTKQLDEFRKRIEDKMYAFKTCEREMKTKAFSKEGLATAAAVEMGTPLAQTTAWLRSAIDDGRKWIEILDYEAQRSKGGGGRRGKKEVKSDAQTKLEATQQHFHHWEALLRMLNNEEIEPEEVDDLQDDIQKVLDEETRAGDMPDISMYEDFDIPPPRPRAENPEPPAVVEEKKPSVPPSAKSAAKKTPPATVNASASASAATKPATAAAASSPAAVAKEKESQSVVRAPAPSPAKAPLSPPAVKQLPVAVPLYAAALPALEDETLEGNPEWLDEAIDEANDDTFGDDAMGGVTAGSLAEMANATSKILGASDWGSRKLDLKRTPNEEPSTVAPAAAAAKPAATRTTITTPLTGASSGTPTNDWERRKLDLKKGTATAVATPPAAAAAAPAAAAAAAAAAVPASAVAAAAASTMILPSKDLVAKPPVPHPFTRFDAMTTNRMLDMSLGNLPNTLDVERYRPYEPPNAIEPVPHFPQEVHPILSSREIYHRFDLETLFFTFYYHQKSFQQYFAAKELKAHSFRYHTDLKRWYQRREKPKETSATSERGMYTYFDFEDTWTQKNVDDFTFEYAFLEDELV